MRFPLQLPQWRSISRLFSAALCLMMLLLPGVSATTDSQPPNHQPEESMNQNPTFTITMKNGQVLTGELYPEIAPESVGNFIALANASFYDGLIFHRVIPGFMIQGGCPNGTGMGGPGYSIKGEFSGNGVINNLKHTRGVLSMARSMRMDSAGSQFFIMVADAPHLDGNYAAFGKVLTGMETADQIVSSKRNNADRPFEDQVIQSIRVETYGVDYPFTHLKQ
jgi:peptidyl-prolyl cis-trans isomerase B (cyclophilin B)